MKLSIISDIKSEKESIIVYGLKLASFMEWEVDIIHVVDPRTQQGVSSSYSDSQTIGAGRKLSIDEIIQRELRNNKLALDNLVSGEGSRLNYPLKINTIVEKNSIESKMREITQGQSNAVIMLSSGLDNNVFASKSDMFDLMKSIPAPYLVIAPGQVFEKYNRISLPTNFTDEDIEQYPKITFLLKKFKPKIEAVDVVKNKDQVADSDLKKWTKSTQKITEATEIETKILTGKQYNDTLVDYMESHQPDLILLFKKDRDIFNKLFKKDLMKELLEKLNMPILFYNRQ